MSIRTLATWGFSRPLALAVMGLLLAVPAFAEEIRLKSGRILQGEIVRVTETTVVLRQGGIEMVYPLANVAYPESLRPTAAPVKPQTEVLPSPPDIPRQAQSAEAARAQRVLGRVAVTVNPPVEFDGMRREAIYALRRRYVDAEPRLRPENYQPSDAVFGEIEDGRPWWGLYGISFYGSGDKAPEGLSEESRFVANPYLLVGLNDSMAFGLNRKGAPFALYPQLHALTWQPARAEAEADYAVRSFLERYRQTYPKYADSQAFELVAYNARDFGFSTLWIDPNASQNIRLRKPSLMPVAIKHYLHCGGSCGVSDGCCNNGSPRQPEFLFEVSRLPARVQVELRRDAQASIADPADFTFVLNLQ